MTLAQARDDSTHGTSLAISAVDPVFPAEGEPVLKGLRTAETAMNIQLNRTNVLANNLANVNSAGFKKVLTQVTERQGPAPGDQDLGQAAPARQVPGNVRDLILDVRAPIDMTQGALRETGRSTDLAIQGEGLFKVRRDGQEFLTRSGAFTLNAERQLVTMAGDQVIGAGGPIQLPPGELLVRENGAILVNGTEVDRLALVNVADPGRLRHVGATLFATPDDMPAQAVPANEVQISQGMLEQSNVNPIDAMVGMIAAQRAFEMGAKVLQNEDRTLDQAINKLAGRA